jgi:hypothetical protein
MAAERNGFAVLVAAIGIAAVAAFEIDERDQARFDPHATELDGFGARQRRLRLHRLGLHGPGGAALARFARPRRACSARHPTRLPGLFRTSEPHALAAADRGVAGIGGFELRVDGVRGFRIGHSLGQEFAQRSGMLRRPIGRLHDFAFMRGRISDRP